MRTSLAPHVGKIVLIKGWVNNWKFPEDSDYFRLSIKNPIIKESDKNIHFHNFLKLKFQKNFVFL